MMIAEHGQVGAEADQDGGAMELQLGRAVSMLVNGMDEDPPAAMAGMLVLSLGLTLGQVVLLRWSDASECNRLLRVDGGYLPLTPVLLEVLRDYDGRTPGPEGGLMFSDASGCSLRVRDLAKRISDLTWFPVELMRAWALAACPELQVSPASARALDRFTASGDDAMQRTRLAAEHVRQLRVAVGEWHECLAGCQRAATG